MRGLRKLSSGDGSIVPSCGDYSTALLLVVLVAHVVMAVFFVFWFCRKTCKRCRGNRMNRATLSSLCLLTVLYAFIIASFSVSVLLFVNQTRNVSMADSGNSSITDSSGNGTEMLSGMGWGSGSGDCNDMGPGDMGSGNMTTCNNTSMPATQRKENCVQLLSESFILVAVFVGMLMIFLSSIMCLFCYECSHNGCCYTRVFYDPTVVVFENESTFM